MTHLFFVKKALDGKNIHVLHSLIEMIVNEAFVAD